MGHYGHVYARVQRDHELERSGGTMTTIDSETAEVNHILKYGPALAGPKSCFQDRCPIQRPARRMPIHRSSEHPPANLEAGVITPASSDRSMPLAVIT